MQTFLPYEDFSETARTLDCKRLGKQRVEAFQILNTLLNRPNRTGKIRTGWKNHPAVRMWSGFENALKLYFDIILEEWLNRGYNNNMKFEEIETVDGFPKWIGNEKFHASHRSNLLRKNPAFYGKFGWNEPIDLPYYWPV